MNPTAGDILRAAARAADKAAERRVQDGNWSYGAESDMHYTIAGALTDMAQALRKEADETEAPE